MEWIQQALGNVIIDNNDVSKFNRRRLIKYRREDIGFVFQFYNLVQNLTAKENVELATQICEDHLDPVEVLKKVGLENRMDNFPSQLSGGALDYVTGKQILKLLQDTCRKENMTVIIITHNGAIAPMADKIIRFKNGIASSIEKNEKPVSVEDIEW